MARLTNEVISMQRLIIKSLLTSLCQREEMCPSFEKRGKGRLFNNDTLLIHFLVRRGVSLKQNKA